MNSPAFPQDPIASIQGGGSAFAVQTGKAMLTSQERVNRMMEHRDHDRIPRHESFWQETITRWQEEGLNGGREEALQI